METKDVLYELRVKSGFTQEEVAEKVLVTRQAVSRWELGATVPNSETLKLLSKLYDVSINTLLGAPRKLICQCCGMELDDTTVSHELDGTINEEYCKWCYTDGKYVYTTLDELADYLAENVQMGCPCEQARAYFMSILPHLRHWKQAEQ